MELSEHSGDGHAYRRWKDLTKYATVAGPPATSLPDGFDQRGRSMSTPRIGPPPCDVAVLPAARAYEATVGDRRVGEG